MVSRLMAVAGAGRPELCSRLKLRVTLTQMQPALRRGLGANQAGRQGEKRLENREK